MSSRLLISSLLALSLGLGPGIVIASEAESTPAAETKKERKVDKRVCKRIRVTGSHMRKRICQKQSAWDQLRRDSQESMRQLNDRQSGATGS